MIGHLSGTVLNIGEETMILDVGGVGYEVSCTPRLLARLEQGSPAALFVETLVAETYIRLIGFEAEAERRMFRLLQTVQGVGAKAALAILQVLKPGDLMDAVAVGDKASVARAQGVGPKLATRIVTELKGKTGGLLGIEDFGHDSAAAGVITDEKAPPIRHDAVLALVGLGYDQTAASRAVAGVTLQEDETLEALITAALKGLSAS